MCVCWVRAQPKVLVTDSGGKICRLVFDELDVLRSITFVGRQTLGSGSGGAGVELGAANAGAGAGGLQVTNLVQLIGLPATYLNRILYRYAQSEITDLVAFLQGTWATALYHESFAVLRQNLHLFLKAQATSNVQLAERLAYLTSLRTEEHASVCPLLLAACTPNVAC